MPCITTITALEILDSRGNPTLRARVTLDERRDRCRLPSPPALRPARTRRASGEITTQARYGGKGVRGAMQAVAETIAPSLRGADPFAQPAIDAALIALDGTADKSRLGANAILGVSMAVARAAASSCGRPLYAYLGGANACRLPVPMMNVINGGAHADNSPRLPGVHDCPARRATLRRGVALRRGDVPCAAGLAEAARPAARRWATKAASRPTCAVTKRRSI